MKLENDTLTKGSLFESVALQSWLTINESWFNGKSYGIRIHFYGKGPTDRLADTDAENKELRQGEQESAFTYLCLQQIQLWLYLSEGYKKKVALQDREKV